MPATTSLGIPYPLGTEPPAAATDMQLLAAKVNDLLDKGYPGTPYAMNIGQVSVNHATAGSTVNTAVTFAAGRFAAAPHVYVSLVSAGPTKILLPRVTPITTSGCTIVTVADTDSTIGTITVSWLAVSMTQSDPKG